MNKLLLLLLLLPAVSNGQSFYNRNREIMDSIRAWSDSIKARQLPFAIQAAYAPVVHAHDYSTLTNKPATFAPSAHLHPESDVNNLTADLSAKEGTITVLPFAKGGVSGAAATSATTGAMTVNMVSSVITITPTGACTLNASGGVAGQVVTFSITTSGVSSFVITFGTNFRKTATLATGTTTARFFTVTFICLDGQIWSETGRTAAQS